MTTTIPPVSVVCLSSLITTATIKIAPTIMGLEAGLAQCEVLPPRLILGDTVRSVVDLAIMPQEQSQLQMPSWAYFKYVLGPQMSFLFWSWTSHWFHSVCVSYGVCLLLLGSNVDAILTSGGSTIEICTTAALQSIPMAGICSSWCWSVAHIQGAVSSCSLYCFEQREPHTTHLSIFQPFNLYGVGRALGFNSHLVPPTSQHGGQESSHPVLLYPMTELTPNLVGIKPCDSSVVIEYLVDKVNCTWPAEHFVTQSHIYPRLRHKVSTLPHILLEPWCDNYSFWDQAVAYFEHGLHSVLTDSGTWCILWWIWCHDWLF